MKKHTLPSIGLILAIVGLLLSITACNDIETTVSFNEEEKAAYALVIHGGAGTILKANMTPEQEAAYLKTLNEALDIGEEMLKNGSSSLDAIEKVILFMENSPLFNAGKGAVFNHAGKNELDASIMDGKTQNAGAVGGVQTVKNPILAARAVMEKSDHVLLTGAGADEFAKEQGLAVVTPDYFYTQRRWDALQKVLKKGNPTGQAASEEDDYKFGTVGAVALDADGNIAAGTSTGGMTNKRYNRVGDSPIIGAGTYANNNTCGISATGHGEFFIRYAVAYDISAMIEYKEISLKQAAKTVINKLKEKGGTGGVIGLDKYGNVAMPFNTAGMYRGYTKPGERKVAIYQQ